MSEIDIAVRTITVFLIPVLFAIALHEAAHGYVARYFGDPTAAEQGRLSLNPIRHIDPFGTVLLPLILHLVGLPPLGFAKPVPVDFNRLRNPKKQMAFVAAAGPAANFAMGVAWTVMQVVLEAGEAPDFFIMMAKAGIIVNSAMCVFNLIPVPPLDGGRIVTGLLPLPMARKYARIELYGVYVFIGLVLLLQFGILDGFLITAMTIVQNMFHLLVYPLILLLN
jgi:Zn-dependent protease